MSKRKTPAGESPESPNKVAKVKTEDGTEVINVGAMSVENAISVLSNLPLHIEEGCTLSAKEKEYGVLCSKWALMEKDGKQARSQYIRQKMVDILGGDWACIIGECCGMAFEAPHMKFKLGEDVILIVKSDFMLDLPLEDVECHLEDSMKEDAIRTIRVAFLLHKDKDDVANHVTEEFEARHKKFWNCCIFGSEGGSSVTYRNKLYFRCTRGKLTIELFKSHDEEVGEDEEDE